MWVFLGLEMRIAPWRGMKFGFDAATGASLLGVSLSNLSREERSVEEVFLDFQKKKCYVESTKLS
jgi:hypothetical protein